MPRRTRVGITLGDLAGIGPEIVAAALAAAPIEWRERRIVYGAREPLERGARAIGVALPELTIVGEGTGAGANAGQPDEAGGAALAISRQRSPPPSAVSSPRS